MGAAALVNDCKTRKMEIKRREEAVELTIFNNNICDDDDGSEERRINTKI